MIRNIYTFSQILNRMTNRLSSTTPLSDFTPGSNVRTMLEVITIFIEYLQFLIENAFKSFYIDTATGDDLINRIQDFNMEKREAVAARGIQTFISATPAVSTFVISAGTQVSTQPDVFGDTISYNLDNDITFVSGALTATGYVTCSILGIDGNVSSGMVTNIPTTIDGITSVNNYEAFTNGSTEETEDQIRKRVPVHLNGLQRANEDGIKSAILEIEGITLVRLEENNPAAGFVTVYVSNESGTLSTEQLEAVTTVAEDSAAFGIEISVITPTVQYITISLSAEIDTENYDEEFVKQDIRDSIDERVRTNPASDLLLYDIILAATVQGVNNIKNVTLDGVAADLEVSGFKVIRLNDPSVDITINTI